MLFRCAFIFIALFSQLSLMAEYSVERYEELSITAEDRYKINQLLMTMADKNVFQLLFERKSLEKLGDEINHVHPVRFLGTVFSDIRLNRCMHRIYNSTFKWSGFMDGFRNRFREEQRAGNVNPYLPGLALQCGVTLEKVRSFVDGKDFEGLVLYLMHNSQPK